MTTSNTRYRYIVFDAVGTLIHARPSVAEAYQQIGKKYGCCLSLSEIQNRFQRVFSARQLSESTSEGEEFRFWKGVVADVLGEVNQANACFEELHDYFGKSASWISTPESELTIKTLLDSGCAVAVASNFDSRLHSVLGGNPVLSRITIRVISSEIGWRKPSSEFYQSLVEVAGCLPEEILMVGDDLRNDVIAAQRSGLDALLYSPNNDSESDRIEITQIRKLDQVLDYLI